MLINAKMEGESGGNEEKVALINSNLLSAEEREA